MNYFENFAPLYYVDPVHGVQTGEGQAEGTTTGTGTPAGYDTVSPVNEPGGFFTLPMLLIWGAVIGGMWFLLIRPQRKREKETREMQQALKVGDKIICTSGFYGKIVGVGEDAFLIEFGENRGLNVWVAKRDIAGKKSPITTAPRESDTPATPTEQPSGLFGGLFKKKNKDDERR